MAKVQITNGDSTHAHVTSDQELSVIPTPYPPFGEQKIQPLRQYFTLDGTPSGNFDMGVDGSATPVDFCIPAHPFNDRYITSINFIIGYGTSGAPYQWADGTALTNGIRLFYENLHGEHDIHDGIKTNQDMFRLSFSPIPAAWEVRHVNANNDFGYFTAMDLTRMGLPYGIKMDAGSTQKLVVTIQDNAGLAADSFNAVGYGFERFK